MIAIGIVFFLLLALLFPGSLPFILIPLLVGATAASF
jgi:hypothetical protein